MSGQMTLKGKILVCNRVKIGIFQGHFRGHFFFSRKKIFDIFVPELYLVEKSTVKVSGLQI